MKARIQSVIEKFMNKKIGHIVVRNSKKPEKEYFGILTKKDFLLFLLRSYKAHTPDKNILNLSVEEIDQDLIISSDKIKIIQKDVKLLDAIAILKDSQISFLPVVDSNNNYEGFINKLVVFYIFKYKLYKYLDKPLHEFLVYAKDKELFSDIFLDSLYFKPQDKMLDVLKKFVFNYAQLVWVDENRKLKGMISLHDIFNIFL